MKTGDLLGVLTNEDGYTHNVRTGPDGVFIDHIASFSNEQVSQLMEMFKAHFDGRAKCMDCDMPYKDFPMDNEVPRAQWLEINPADEGLLCPNCIVKRAQHIKGVLKVHMIFEVSS